MQKQARFSVIIPTMQRSPRLIPLLGTLVANDLVGEVVVINNAPTPLPFDHAKVRTLDQEQNIFVYPAWNLGVKEAREDLLLLCNDDITFDPSYIDFAARLLRLPIGIAAPAPRSVTRRRASPLRWTRPTYRRSYAYGILMALRKDSYVSIPDDLLISSGDTFLFDRQSRRNIQNRPPVSPSRAHQGLQDRDRDVHDLWQSGVQPTEALGQTRLRAEPCDRHLLATLLGSGTPCQCSSGPRESGPEASDARSASA